MAKCFKCWNILCTITTCTIHYTCMPLPVTITHSQCFGYHWINWNADLIIILFSQKLSNTLRQWAKEGERNILCGGTG